MKKSYLIIVIILSIVLLGLLFFGQDLFNFYLNFSRQLPEIKKGVVTQLNQLNIETKIYAPPPLRAREQALQSLLTQAGVIKYTNIEREKYGRPLFRENTQLNASAEIKTKDMLEQQYFAHGSTTGINVGDLAKSVNYDFITIGENLALGNFKDDQALVQAWMDSPGHRENILSLKFQEVGVSVIKGIFEGESTWLAVQHLGLPLSVCPAVDQNLKEEIETNQSRLQEMLKQITIFEIEIKKSARPKNREDRENMIKEYEALIEQYNNLIDENQIIIDLYNQQVILFNNCLGGVR